MSADAICGSCEAADAQLCWARKRTDEYSRCYCPCHKAEERRISNSPIVYPVRVQYDVGSIWIHIRDASNRVIAAGLLGRDAHEICRALNIANPAQPETHRRTTEYLQGMLGNE